MRRVGDSCGVCCTCASDVVQALLMLCHCSVGCACSKDRTELLEPVRELWPPTTSTYVGLSRLWTSITGDNPQNLLSDDSPMCLHHSWFSLLWVLLCIYKSYLQSFTVLWCIWVSFPPRKPWWQSLLFLLHAISMVRESTLIACVCMETSLPKNPII